MFVKMTEFHWQGLVGPAAAILGLAFLLTAASILIYLRAEQPSADKRKIDIKKLKRMGVFGLILIGAGLAAFAVFSGGELLTSQYEFAAPVETDVGKIYYQPFGKERIVPLREMVRKTWYGVEKDALQMKSDGYIETPFLFLGSGSSALEFDAAGTIVDNEKSKILTGILVWDKGGTSLAGDLVMRELTPEKKKYVIPLGIVSGQIAAIRIEFINATNKEKKAVRMVTVSSVVLKRE